MTATEDGMGLRVPGRGFRGLGLRVKGLGLCLGLRVKGLGFMFRVEGLGVGVLVLGTWYESLLFGAIIATQKEKDRTFLFGRAFHVKYDSGFGKSTRTQMMENQLEKNMETPRKV